MIPKIAHFYWGGGPLPYINYLTLATFKYHNPLWKMVLYSPHTPTKNAMTFHKQKAYGGDDYIQYAKKIVDHRIVDLSKIGIPSDIHDVQRSDLFRWHILSTTGGLWSDMDILYVNQVERWVNLDKDAFICQENIVNLNKELQSIVYIGFLLASKNNVFFKYVDNLAKNIMITQYQSVGSSMFNKIAQRRLTKVENIHPSLLYTIFPSDPSIKSFFELNGNITTIDLKKKLGFHWYNGNIISQEKLLPTTPTHNPLVKGTFFHALLTESMKKAKI